VGGDPVQIDERRHVPPRWTAHARAGQAAAPARDRRSAQRKAPDTTLGWFPDEDPARRSWLIAATAAGSASHPAWYFNLAKRPDEVAIEVDGERVAVRAESLSGDERERAWGRVVALAPGYGKYARDTDREIPVVRLVPRAS
jgi:deazaflavin-dependent oxidoreductase (nitroreductase family)